MADLRLGEVLADRYKIEDRLAAGGMGVVYRAERLKLGRTVAVKFLHHWSATEESSRKRFEIEAQAMGRLHHANCVSVTDFGIHEGAPYLVMDFVIGESLADVLADGPLAPARAVDVGRQVLAGLAHAHTQNIVHRDIKPANIMVTTTEGFGDSVKILDFGVAKLLGQSSELTAGLAIGTPSYMAPEQTASGIIDERTDLYSVGILLFKMLTGERPFVADDPYKMLVLHRESPRPSLFSVAPKLDVPRSLDSVLVRAMAIKTRDRFASAADMAAALTEALGEGSSETAATPDSSGQKPVADALAATAIADSVDLPLGPDESTHAHRPSSPKKKRAAKPSASATAHVSHRSRLRPAMWIGAGLAVVAAVALGVTLFGGDDDTTPAAASIDDTQDTIGVEDPESNDDRRRSRKTVTGPKGVDAEIARLIRLGRSKKQSHNAATQLKKLRNKYPSNAKISLALGRIYYERPFPTGCIKAYRSAIKLDREYRHDETTIRHAILTLNSASAKWQAVRLLRVDIGRPALPYLDDTAANHKNGKLRKAAARVAKQIRRGS